MLIGDRIKKRRELLDISQIELAEKIGVSKQTLYKYENNIVTNIPSDKIENLAKFLKTTPAFLMGWEKEIDVEISKELQISKEALYIINKFPLTIDINTGHSMMDIFNAMVVHNNFEEILKDILLYIARSEDDWQKMTDNFSDNGNIKSIDKKTMQSLCFTNIIKEFEQLISDILSSNIKTFNYVKKDNTGNLSIGIRPENEYLYKINDTYKHTDTEATNKMHEQDDEHS